MDSEKLRFLLFEVLRVELPTQLIKACFRSENLVFFTGIGIA
jgi:hypothetical protein